MSASKILIFLLAGLAAMAMTTGVASAEFTSLTKSATGKGELIEFSLVGGGGTVHCSALGEKESAVGWTVKNSKEAAEKGAHLVLKPENWGQCTAKASGVETSASISGCELELTEVEEEVSVPLKVLTTCTIKASICTVTVEPAENEKLSSVNTYPSGDENVNSLLEFQVNNTATKTTAGCAFLGIKATKEGSMTGVAEAKEVKVQRRNEFSVDVAPRVYSNAVTSGTITYRRVAAGARGYQFHIFNTSPAGNFSLNVAQQGTCDNLNFASGQTCSVAITYNQARGTLTVGVIDLNGEQASLIVRGT
jgi:hypothetical protein